MKKAAYSLVKSVSHEGEHEEHEDQTLVAGKVGAERGGSGGGGGGSTKRFACMGSVHSNGAAKEVGKVLLKFALIMALGILIFVVFDFDSGGWFPSARQGGVGEGVLNDANFIFLLETTQGDLLSSRTCTRA